jgi:thiopeptide-type bacteriocin biosynthesis protein
MRTEPLYSPLPFVMLRAPAYPVEAYQGLSSRPAAAEPRETDGGRNRLPGRDDLHVHHAWVRNALAIASPALYAAMERNGSKPRESKAAREKLLSYLIRMSTRPTPYGLFSGVALAQWGDGTDLSLSDSAPVVRTRPDMQWLHGIVGRVEGRPEVRPHLRCVVNPLAWVAGGRVFLGEGGGPAQEKRRRVSIRASAVVRRVLGLAREPIPYRELLDRILEAFAVPGSVAEHLLDELLEQRFLFTDLCPPASGLPAHHVVRRLAQIPEAQAEARDLEELLSDVSAWDGRGEPSAGDGFERLDRRARALFEAEHAFQVDMALPLAGRSIARRVADEAARAAEILFRLTPLPHGQRHLDGYRQKFEEHYGGHRQIPLLELLDPDLGLGTPVAPAETMRFERRHARLLALALGALRERRRVVELDDEALAGLATWTPEARDLPTSLDLYFFVAARSAAELDAGEFQVIVAPSVGVTGAGRTLGRFGDVLGAPALDAIRAAADADETRDRRLWAEVYYKPARTRSANVAVRPAVRRYEVRLDGVPPGRSDAVNIPLDELVVGLRDGRFYVRWPAANADVVSCAGHLLNAMQGPAVLRFLCDASHDGQAVLTGFDWGPAREFPYLPRVQSGKSVLHPAQWRIGVILGDRWRGTFEEALSILRDEWQLPRHVFVTTADNRLLVDLDDAEQSALIARQVTDAKRRRELVLQEVLPELDRIWTPGPGGRYVTELVASLVLKSDSEPPRTRPEARSAPRIPIAGPRFRPPGSDWLYLRLCAPPCLQDDVLAAHLSGFAEDVLQRGLADRWFFIRYSDPEPHLRIRFRGAPARLTGELLPAACTWAAELVERGLCGRFSFETYDREIERYGGEAGLALAEEIFAADSRAVVRLLALERAKQLPIERGNLAVLVVDDLLATLGLDETARLTWSRRFATLRNECSDEYRQKGPELRDLLRARSAERTRPDQSAVMDILTERRDSLRATACSLQTMEETGTLERSRDDILASLVHMTLNRLLGTDNAPERRVMGLLLRTRESLAALARRVDDPDDLLVPVGNVSAHA